jgi:hypothetical protein
MDELQVGSKTISAAREAAAQLTGEIRMKTSSRRARTLACALLATTAFAVPAAAQTTAIIGPVSIDRFTVSPGGVDLRSGNFTYSSTDLSIGEGTPAGGLSLVRTGDNGKLHTERFGQFSHNWEIYLVESYATSNGLTIGGSGPTQLSINAQGRSNTFRSTAPRASYVSMGGSLNPSNAKLHRVQSGTDYFYRYTAPDGTLITFSNMTSAKCAQLNGRCAYATEVVLPTGVTYTLSYDNLGTANARLRQVVSNTGLALVLEYTAVATLPYISKACVLNLAHTPLPVSNTCPAGAPTASYQYSGNFLGQFTDASLAQWQFGNSYVDGSSDYTLSFYKPGVSSPYLVNTYLQDPSDSYFRVVSRQVLTPGATYYYSYRTITHGDILRGAQEVAGGSYSYDGKTVSAQYGAYRPPKVLNDNTLYVTAKPERITDEIGRVHVANYCVPYGTNGGCRPTALQHLTDPEGIKTLYNYDSALNVLQTVTQAKLGTGLPDIVRSATYNCSNVKACAKPTSVTDPKGNVSNFSYSADHGGILSETGPAVNGVRPQKRYTYQQRHAWTQSGAGYVRSATPIWLLVQESSCASGAASGPGCAVAGDEIKTLYDYGPDSGPNNLLLRGIVKEAGGLSLRSCFAYDSDGNKISETSPRAGLTSCN